MKREYYPMPTIEEVSTRLKNALLFTVLDAKNGFWQIPLDEKSSMLTCFNTPFGRYRWLRMPFGINSAPEIWQRTTNQLVEGLAGTEVIHDDFLIVGCGTTDEEAEIDHDKNLREFLDRARERAQSSTECRGDEAEDDGNPVHWTSTHTRRTPCGPEESRSNRENAWARGRQSCTETAWLGELIDKVRPTSVRYTRAPQTTHGQGYWMVLVEHTPAGFW